METEKNSDNIQPIAVQNRKNYSVNCKCGGVTIPCYSKKQMKSLYPKGVFKVAGEYAPGAKTGGAQSLQFGEHVLPLSKYGTNSRVFYRIKGFAAVEPGEDRYVVLLKKVLVLRAALCAAIVVLLIAGVVLLASQPPKDVIPTTQTSSTPGAPELESGAVEWEGVKVSEPENTPAEGIRIPGFKSITIEADTAEVSVNFQNPEQNNCYFVIRLVLKDTGETLYESKMIEPGKGLYTITLSRALAAGSYPAKLQYEPYDMTSLTRLNGAEINLELIAK